jgi:acetyl-CoA acetyltransferase family protein
MTKSYIPYRAYWSSPFCRWQGSLANTNSLELVATAAAGLLADRGIASEQLDSLVLGVTVPQHHSFYGAPWVAGMMGAAGLTGPSVSQACATSVRALAMASASIAAGQDDSVLALTCDRTSNGPHVVYPNPGGPGGTAGAENWVWDNFNRDPHAGNAMIQTAENVAKHIGVGKDELDDIALLRFEQYQRALADDRAFQRRYMRPAELRHGRKVTAIEADEGIHPTTKDGLAKLRPVLDGGVVSFGSQTHPADGNAGIIVCSKDRAGRLSQDAAVTIALVSFGEARVAKGMMPMAPVPAARQALERAGIAIGDCRAIKSHNPFAVNDAYFCRELGLEPEQMNNYGSSLVYGHPQAPTGMRTIIELIEELALLGGGFGLFTGCAAGDTAMAVVLKVG